ncbi:P-selectin glycoprotein ligand 1 [Rhinophrynus dorsalis]
MTSLWIILLHVNGCFLLAVGYKIPVLSQEQVNTVNVKPLQDSNSSLLGKLEQEYPRLLRMKRQDTSTLHDLLEDSTSPTAGKTIAVTEKRLPKSPLKNSSDTTPKMIHTTPVVSEAQSIPGEPEMTEDETTPLSHTVHDAFLEEDTTTSQINESTETIPQLNPTSSPGVLAGKAEGFEQSTSFGHILTEMTLSAKQPKNVTAVVVEYITSVLPSKPTVTLGDSSTEHDETSSWKSDHSVSSTSTAGMTKMIAPSGNVPPPQSLMKQCMLVILILAVVCTFFVITTIALAAKLSTLKSHYKLRQSNLTEMTCITSLLPESDQQNKFKPKRMKTFAANVEESDGDNATLNSFLPDHS